MWTTRAVWSNQHVASLRATPLQRWYLRRSKPAHHHHHHPRLRRVAARSLSETTRSEEEEEKGKHSSRLAHRHDHDRDNRRHSRPKVVFLGTPACAIPVLEALNAANHSGQIELVGVVSQPPSRRGRNKKTLVHSPISTYAEQHSEQQEEKEGGGQSLIRCPQSARDAEFLQWLEERAPDICVTAAYGQFLPQRFLDIPKRGTVNIHPSLLPKYRGAAPVQRALCDGVRKTGVTLLFTELRMDSGPIIAQREFDVDDQIKATQLLDVLFKIGAEMLMENVSAIASGEAGEFAMSQDDSEATLAPKIDVQERWLYPTLQTAQEMHNRIRGLAGWPGTRMKLQISQDGKESSQVDMIVLTATAVSQSLSEEPGSVVVSKDKLLVVCQDGRCLDISEIQLPGKKPMAIKAFLNGLGNMENPQLCIIGPQ